jgi:hypothetical protein
MPLTDTKHIPDARAAVTLRLATEADAGALRRLAAVDSARVLSSPVLVADVGGELWAAVSLQDGGAIADPFRPSGELLGLLLERSRQLAAVSAASGRRRAGRLLRPRPAT